MVPPNCQKGWDALRRGRGEIAEGRGREGGGGSRGAGGRQSGRAGSGIWQPSLPQLAQSRQASSRALEEGGNPLLPPRLLHRLRCASHASGVWIPSSPAAPGAGPGADSWGELRPAMRRAPLGACGRRGMSVPARPGPPPSSAAASRGAADPAGLAAAASTPVLSSTGRRRGRAGAGVPRPLFLWVPRTGPCSAPAEGGAVRRWRPISGVWGGGNGKA